LPFIIIDYTPLADIAAFAIVTPLLRLLIAAAYFTHAGYAVTP